MTVTVAASPEALEWLKKNQTGAYFYLGLSDYGCNGKGYDIKFIEVLPEGEHVLVHLDEQMSVVVPKKDASFISGMQLKMVQDGAFGSRMVFDNPNVRNECGCGKSMSF